MIEIKKWWRDYNNYDQNFHLLENSKLFNSTGINISLLNLTNLSSQSFSSSSSFAARLINNYTIGHEIDAYRSPGLAIILILIYGIIIIGGIVGNISLIITLYSTSSVRLRNPLLVALCLADFLVASLATPATIIASSSSSWTLSFIGCKIIYFIQSMPVAASTLSFFMLSLDRYATVKNPSLAQLRQRRYVHAVLALLSWFGANIICVPILLAYKISKNYSDESMAVLGKCYPDYGSIELQTTFILTHTIIVFLVPGLGVLLNYYGVRRKLCALSLTERARHGELPLPMPILHRPTHMIIVTGLPANAGGGVAGGKIVQNSQKSSDDDDDDDDDADGNGIAHNKILMVDTIINSATSKSPRVMREIRAQQRRQKLEQNKQPQQQQQQQNSASQQQQHHHHHHHHHHQESLSTAAPGLPLSQTSTLRARRKLANMLIATAVIFIICWTPHVFCIMWTEFGQNNNNNNKDQYCSITISHFSLLLGYMHSVISPILYWILNHNSLRQSPCAPLIRFSTIQRIIRNYWRSPTAPPPPPSSTNEAALGAFNPRYIKTTPKQYRAQASSHYLY